MYYPDDLVEEVRMKNDIVDVISGYVRLQKKGANHFGLCPFHNEKSPSFSVSGPKQMYYCFGCGAGGNVFTFIMEYENYTFAEAVKMLAERAGVNLPEIEYSEEQRISQILLLPTPFQAGGGGLSLPGGAAADRRDDEKVRAWVCQRVQQ